MKVTVGNRPIELKRDEALRRLDAHIAARLKAHNNAAYEIKLKEARELLKNRNASAPLLRAEAEMKGLEPKGLAFNVVQASEDNAAKIIDAELFRQRVQQRLRQALTTDAIERIIREVERAR